MEVKTLNTWEDFVTELERLRTEANGRGSHMLFRGQSDASWGLETTLERAGQAGRSLSQYFKVLLRVRPAIEAHTGQRWALPTFKRYSSWTSDYDGAGGLGDWKAYDFMAYLRHHGFPSPLLDWSRSPFVAAFFAFQPLTGVSERVAIYIYRERADRTKHSSSSKPQIRQLPEYVRTHARHFRQQCEYTVCVEYKQDLFEAVASARDVAAFHYAKHQTVFGSEQERDLFGNAYQSQDQLWKFSLPRTERPKVIRMLNDFNLNAYSLFGTEDSLMSTLAEKEFRHP